MKSNLTLPILIFAISASCLHAATKDWPAWRGPDESGSNAEGTYPERIDDSTILWKIPLPGKGCSTPIVVGERIVLAGPADDGQDSVTMLDWNGKTVWNSVVGKGREGKHRNGSSSNSSPVTDGERVFAYFKSGNVAGLDLKGKVLWTTNLQERFGKDTLFWDIGTSPVLTKKHVVVAVMHKGESYLVAFDKATGEMAWKASRNYQTPVEGDHSYATPIVREIDGVETIVTWGAEHVTGHDAITGKLIWECGGFNPDEKKNWVAVASAVITGEVIVVPYGRGKMLAGIQLGGKGDTTESHRLWTRDDDHGAFVPSPVVSGGKVYLVRDRGEVVCLDPKSGETIWKDKLPRGSASYYSSPSIGGGNLYAAREDGVLFIAKISDGKLELLSENNLGERVIASPVPVADRLLLRGEQHLICAAKGK